MNKTRNTILLLIGTIAICPGELLVYEPFDYKPHNDEIAGRLESRNGGLGFGEGWKDTTGAEGFAFVYDQRGNPEDLYAGDWGAGEPAWDGVVDNLPTMGGYVGISDWDRTGAPHSTRKLARSAGEMAKGNGGVLWLSAVWHMPNQSFFPPVGIALASDESGFKDRAIAMDGQADAIGAGNGRNFRERKRLNPVIWKEGEEVAGAPGSNIDGKKDNIVILKFEFGETDKVSTWYFTEDQEMTESAFDENAASCSSDIDENTLDVLTICTILPQNAIDEIRIGTDFKSVISGSIPARREVKITKQLHDPKTDRYYLEWSSNPGETYGIYVVEETDGYKPCVAAAVEAAKDKGTTTFGPFANPIKGNGKLRFEIGFPDTTPPTIGRVWGSGTKVSLIFSEPMMPTTSLSPSNYAVTEDGGRQLAVESAAFDPESGSVTLTTKEALKPDTAYTVSTRSLTDLANHPLVEPQASLRTWDDDPKGIKVFILSGQSNMVGYGHTEEGQNNEVGGVGTLRYLAMHDSEYPEFDYSSLLVDPKEPATSGWKTRSNVKLWWRNGANAQYGGAIFKGDLGPLTSNGRWFGPEFGFGQVIGDHYKGEDVLLIKPSWGGHNLVSQFRSPNAVAKRGGAIGPSYIEMFKDVQEVLFNLDKEFPEWKGRGYQIVGFAWHQGTSDKAPDKVADEYKLNLPDFISSVRSEFGKPGLPFVIATTGMDYGGESSDPPYENYHAVEKAQLWVAGVERPANVLSDDTRKYFEPPETSPRNQGFHWNGNARSYFRVGKGLGDNMVELLTK
ncbi:Ig-like domain-containing protein [Akkermansiaceae bacterium]|nr:Ig-like domain-containing protein [Akkermansiaceae bacterium]